MNRQLAFLGAVVSTVVACGSAPRPTPSAGSDPSLVPASTTSQAAYGIRQWHVLWDRSHVDGLAADGTTKVSIDTVSTIDATGNGAQTQTVTLPNGDVVQAVIAYATPPGETAVGGTVTMTRNDFLTRPDAVAVLQNLSDDVTEAIGSSSLTTPSSLPTASAFGLHAEDALIGGGADLTCNQCATLLQNYNSLLSDSFTQCALTVAGATLTTACGAGAAGASGIAGATGAGATAVPWIIGLGTTCVAVAGSATYDSLKGCIASVQGAAGQAGNANLGTCRVAYHQGPCGSD